MALFNVLGPRSAAAISSTHAILCLAENIAIQEECALVKLADNKCLESCIDLFLQSPKDVSFMLLTLYISSLDLFFFYFSLFVFICAASAPYTSLTR